MRHKCPICGKEFDGTADKVYCSLECKAERQKERKREQRREHRDDILVCEYCGEQFPRGHRTKRFCSKRCSELARKNWQDENPEPVRKKPQSGTMADIARIAREAAEHHMSYGRYIATRGEGR